jgi:TPP-dependent 2-oxoacid decarboxylase
MGLGFALLPQGVTFHNQTLWGSTGWATPAALGAAVASTRSGDWFAISMIAPTLAPTTAA